MDVESVARETIRPTYRYKARSNYFQRGMKSVALQVGFRVFPKLSSNVN